MTDGGQDFNLGHVVGDTGPKGDKGDTGNGIASIVLRSTSGKVKTYRITFTDGNTFDYQVTDGSDASVTIVSSWNSTTSDSKVPSEKLTKDSLDAKANTGHTHTISNVTNLQTTLDGKASSTHTHTISDVTNLQTTLDGKASSSHSHSISDVTNLQSSLNAKANSSDLGTVATSNSYEDLDDIPSSFTPASHTHAISDVTNLQTNLNGKINTSNIANNLTTTSSGKVLDARQGKALADLIGGAIQYINQ